jgi:hypothetical protein
MSRKNHGTIPGLVRQPGRTLVLKQDDSATGQVKYRCEAGSAFGLAPSIGSPHPDSAQVLCYNTSITILENEIAEITCNYPGIFRDPNIYPIEFIGNVGEEPIETHKDFVSKIGGTAASPKNAASSVWRPGSLLGSRQMPRVTWEECAVTSTRPARFGFRGSTRTRPLPGSSIWVPSAIPQQWFKATRFPKLAQNQLAPHQYH